MCQLWGREQRAESKEQRAKGKAGYRVTEEVWAASQR